LSNNGLTAFSFTSISNSDKNLFSSLYDIFKLITTRKLRESGSFEGIWKLAYSDLEGIKSDVAWIDFVLSVMIESFFSLILHKGGSITERFYLFKLKFFNEI
jgi:hypothetical protein